MQLTKRQRAARQRKQLTDRAKFEGAMRAEALGQHPGQVEVRLVAEVRSAVTGWQRVNEWKVELLVGEYEELLASRTACEAGLKAWVEGCVRDGSVECPSCGSEVPLNKKRVKQ